MPAAGCTDEKYGRWGLDTAHRLPTYYSAIALYIPLLTIREPCAVGMVGEGVARHGLRPPLRTAWRSRYFDSKGITSIRLREQGAAGAGLAGEDAFARFIVGVQWNATGGHFQRFELLVHLR